MNTELAQTSNETHADFTAAHLALLQEFHDKAVAILRKDDPKMSELNAALTMLIKVEKQRYYILHRRPLGQKRKHSSIIPFNPSPERDCVPLPAESVAAHSSTPSIPSENKRSSLPAANFSTKSASPKTGQSDEIPENDGPKGSRTDGPDNFNVQA